MRCQDPTFQDWLFDCFEDTRGELQHSHADPETLAKAMLCSLCEIESRKELDTNVNAGEVFDSTIRKPYAEFLREQG